MARVISRRSGAHVRRIARHGRCGRPPSQSASTSSCAIGQAVIHVDTSFLIDLLRRTIPARRGTATSYYQPTPMRPWAFRYSWRANCSRALRARRIRSASTSARARVAQRRGDDISDDRFAERYGEVVDRLQSRGRTVAQMDLLIALTAIVDGASLVTANRRHFEVVPDLTVMAYR